MASVTRRFSDQRASLASLARPDNSEAASDIPWLELTGHRRGGHTPNIRTWFESLIYNVASRRTVSRSTAPDSSGAHDAPGQGVPEVVAALDQFAAAADAQWKTGDVILDLYEIRNIFEGGGMGLVYRAYHRAWDMELAIKSPRPEVFRTRLQKERFVAECEAWTHLGLHPNTVACYYVRTIDQVPRVFAEFVEGGNLQEWIESRRLYAGSTATIMERLLDVAIQFAWGLHHAHRNGEVHQDVKPSNVMMTQAGVAKVTDFGLARARQALGELPSRRTDSRNILVSSGGSTPAYRSPEQAAREKLSLKTDLWSWAVSVLEMFNGDISWTDGQVADEALREYFRKGPAVAGIPSIPDSVATLLRQCFQRLPDARPTDMFEVCRRLVDAYQHILGTSYARAHIVEVLAGDEPGDVLGSGSDVSNRALSMHDLGKTPEALDLLEKRLADHPYDALPWWSHAALLIRLKQASVAEVARELTELVLPNSPRWEELGIDPNRLLTYVASHFVSGHSGAVLHLRWAESPELISADVDGAVIRWIAGPNGWVIHERMSSDRRGLTACLVSIADDQLFLGFETGQIERRVLSTGKILGVLDLSAAAKQRGAVVPQSGKPISRAIAGIVRVPVADVLRVYLRSPDDFVVSLPEWKVLEEQHLPRTLTVGVVTPDDSPFVVLGEEWGLLHLSRDGWIDEQHYFQISHEVEGATAGTMVTNRIELAAVAVSRDGKWIAAGTRRGAVLIFLPGEVLGRPWSHGDEPAAIEWRGASEDPIRALAFSPDSDTLFFCDSLNTLWRGDLNTKTLTEIARFDGDVSALAVSPDGRTIAIGTDKGSIQFEPISDSTWPAPPLLISRPTPSDEYVSRRREIRSILRRAEGALQANRYQECLDYASQGIALSRVQGIGEESFRSLMLQVPGERVAVSEVRVVWNRSFHQTDAAHTSPLLHGAELSADERSMIVGSDDGLHQLRLVDGGLVQSFSCPQVSGITYHSRLGAFLACTGCPHSTLAVLGPKGVGVFRTPVAPVSLNAIAAIRDETTGLAVVVGDSGRFILWQGEDKFQTATVGSGPLLAVSVSPDGTWAAVGDVEGRVLCVDVLSGRRLANLEGHTAAVRCLDMSPTGEIVASCSDDCSANLWAVETRKVRVSLDHGGNHVRAVRFSPLGEWLVTGDDAGTIRFWHTGRGRLEHSFQTPYGEIAGLSFDRSGGLLVSAHLLGTVCLWRLTWSIDVSAEAIEVWCALRRGCEMAQRRSARPFR